MSEISATTPPSVPATTVTAEPLPDLAALFAQHHQRLLRIAFLLSGDDRLAEDLVSDAFAKAYRHLARGRVADPGAYLRRAVVNGWKRQIGRRIRDRERARHLRVGWDPAFEDTSAERERILSALATLPARQRAVVVLRFLDDLSEAETAAVLGIAPGSVKTHSHRALARLRTTLEEDR
ncbi:MAG TPA: sigma-70 family RNA polymerase sigma factor [Iamia sp.]|nr:sigma-70 family RNA polymerase sigma factor [Iamia sp.]